MYRKEYISKQFVAFEQILLGTVKAHLLSKPNSTIMKNFQILFLISLTTLLQLSVCEVIPSEICKGEEENSSKIPKPSSP